MASSKDTPPNRAGVGPFATGAAHNKQHAALGAVFVDMLVGVDSAGDDLPSYFNSLPQVLAYTGDNLTTVTVSNGVYNWVQTFTYVGDNCTGISRWVRSLV